MAASCWSARSCRNLPDPLVDGDGDDDQNADREILPQQRQARERQPVAEHPDDQGAEQRTDDRAAPTTLRTPISFFLKNEFAVERLIKFIHTRASTKTAKALI